MLRNCGNWIGQKINGADSYSSTVQMTFNGKTEFTTFYGGCVSILIKVIIWLYAGLLVTRILSRSDSQKSASTMIKDLTYETEKHYIGKDTFAFAVKLTGPNPELLLDTSYFRFSVNNAKYSRDASYGLTKTVVPIEMEPCGDNFPSVEKDVYDRRGLSLFLWPKNTDYFLRSNLNSDKFNAIEIYIQKCNTGCQPDAVIKNILDTHFAELALINSYFDFEDYENPVRTYLEDVNIYGLTANQCTVPIFE